MNRTVEILAMLLVIVIGGCNTSATPAPFSKSNIEDALKVDLALADISLTENSDGTFTGTGTRSYGTKYTIDVEPDEAENGVKWTAETDSGDVRRGSWSILKMR